MSRKKFLQSNNAPDNIEFLSDKELIIKIKETVKKNLKMETALNMPKIKELLISDHYEKFRKQQYGKLEYIYKTHWYRNKCYGFLEKDEYAYGFEYFFNFVYDNIDKNYNLDIILEDENILLEVFEELGFKNEL